MKTQFSSFEYAVLFKIHPAAQPAEFILEGEVCTIGRWPGCDIVLAGQRIVSRMHATIERAGPRYLLRDANSANGTFVNERQISEPHLLQDEDVIGLGAPQAMLRFSDPDPTDVWTSRLAYNSHKLKFSLYQQELNLTPGEFKLLHFLYQHRGDVCTRERCFEVVWERQYEPRLTADAEALDKLLHNIRHKIKNIDSTAAEIIKTHRGQGYELIVENSP